MIINTILVLTGSIIILLGIAAFFIPSFSKIINFPGGPRLKAIAATSTGIILVLVGLLLHFPVS